MLRGERLENGRYLNGQNLIDEAVFWLCFGSIMIEHQSSPIDLSTTIPHWFAHSPLLRIEANKSCPPQLPLGSPQPYSGHHMGSDAINRFVSFKGWKHSTTQTHRLSRSRRLSQQPIDSLWLRLSLCVVPVPLRMRRSPNGARALV